MIADNKRKEFGDFQTPSELALSVCAFLKKRGIRPRSIIEPTCGIGNFARAALATWTEASLLYGMDVNPEYVAQARSNCADLKAQFHLGSFFEQDWNSILEKLPTPGLVIGNLPWVTNAQMGTIGGSNLPEKSNFQGRNGLDAITGKANFDISEWMLLKMLDWCDHNRLTVALFVKTAVARKVLKQAWQKGTHLGDAAIYRIDAMKWFGAAVDACLFVFSHAVKPEAICPVHDHLDASPNTIMGFQDGELLGDIRKYEEVKRLLGGSAFRWRSGVKHDCSKVMEFNRGENGICNGWGEWVDLESDYIYPLFKSSQLARGDTATQRCVLVTQKYVGAATNHISKSAPKTWSYLTRHSRALDAREYNIQEKLPFRNLRCGGLHVLFIQSRDIRPLQDPSVCGASAHSG